VISSAQLALAVLVLLVPGACLLLALGVRDLVALFGAAAPVTAGLALVAAMVFAISGIPFHAASFGVFTLLVLLAAGVPMHRRRRRRAVLVDPNPPTAGNDLEGGARPLARTLGWLAGAAAVGLGSLTWFRGMGSWATPSQEHDPIVHSVATAYIHFTGNAAPWQVLPVDLASHASVSYYPAGFPALSALVTDFFGNPMTGMNLLWVAALAVAWPMSAAAFAALAARTAGYGRGWTELAAGVAALIAAVLYRPGFAFAHDGGILPNAVALVMVPGLLAALLTVRPRQWPRALAVAVGCAGVVSIHPSAAVSLGSCALAVWVGMAFGKSGRAHLRSIVAPLAVVAGAALVLLIPTLLGAAGSSGLASSWTPEIPAQSPSGALGQTLTLAYGGYFDPTSQLSQLTLGTLAIAAVMVALLLRRGWVVLAPWLVWVAITIDFRLSPTAGVGSLIGGFFYRSANRISAHVYAFTPSLIGFGAVAVLCVLVTRTAHVPHRFRFRERPVDVAIPALVVVGLVLAAFTATTLVGYARVNAHTVAERYSDPQFTRYGNDDAAAIAWLDGKVKPGERIMNNANDGSTLGYVSDELPIVNDHSMGLLDYPYTIDLLARFDQYPQDADIRALIIKLDIAWVYVDTDAPGIGDNSQGRLGPAPYTVAPGLTQLADLPGLTPVYSSGHVHIYHVSLAAVAALGRN
jgi:hypothetical protein